MIKNNYNKYIELYNAVIKNLNLKIDDINSKHSSNQVTQRQNIYDIKVAINQIKENYVVKKQNVNAWLDYKRKREIKRIEENYYVQTDNKN